MGKPSQLQIDERIADGVARGLDEEKIFRRLTELERWTNEELAGIGVVPYQKPAPEALPTAPDMTFFVVEHARRELPPPLDRLGDVALTDCPADLLNISDFDPIEEPEPRG